MAKYTPIKYKEQSGCDILIDGAEDSFKKLGNYFDDAFDDSKTKMNVVGSIFCFGASLTKLAFNATAKRDLLNAIEEEVRETQKQLKEDLLNEKIKQIRLKA